MPLPRQERKREMVGKVGERSGREGRCQGVDKDEEGGESTTER